MIINFIDGTGGSGSGYTLPIASSSVLGGVMIGSGITIDASGKISAAAEADLSGLFASVEYDSSATSINFYDKSNTLVGQVDASSFVIDGMIEDVYITGSTLVIEFNTAAGKEDIEIDLTDIFNPANYYTKAEVDAEITGATSPIQSQVDDIERVTATAYTELHTDIVALSGATQDMATQTWVNSQNFVDDSDLATAMVAETARTESTYLKSVPTATTNDFGVVKIGSGITVTNGVISVNAAAPTGEEQVVNKVCPSQKWENYQAPVGSIIPIIDVDGVFGLVIDRYNSAEFQLSGTEDGNDVDIAHFLTYTTPDTSGDLIEQKAIATDTDTNPRLIIKDYYNDTILYEFTAMTPSEYAVDDGTGNGNMLHISLTQSDNGDVYRIWKEDQSGNRVYNTLMGYDFIKNGDGIQQIVWGDWVGNQRTEKIGATLYARDDMPFSPNLGDVISTMSGPGVWASLEPGIENYFRFQGDPDSNPYGVNEFTIASVEIDDVTYYIKLMWDTEEETWYYHADGCDGKPYVDDRDGDGPYYIDNTNIGIDSYDDGDGYVFQVMDEDEEYQFTWINPGFYVLKQYDGETWNEIGNPDLSNYYTKSEVDAEIASATTNFVTSGDVEDAITAATSGFVTSGEVNNQIAVGTANMVNSDNGSGLPENPMDADLCSTLKSPVVSWDSPNTGVDEGTLNNDFIGRGSGDWTSNFMIAYFPDYSVLTAQKGYEGSYSIKYWGKETDIVDDNYSWELQSSGDTETIQVGDYNYTITFSFDEEDETVPPVVTITTTDSNDDPLDFNGKLLNPLVGGVVTYNDDHRVGEYWARVYDEQNIKEVTGQMVKSLDVRRIIPITQTDYDNLPNGPDDNTLYLITNANA